MEIDYFEQEIDQLKPDEKNALENYYDTSITDKFLLYAKIKTTDTVTYISKIAYNSLPMIVPTENLISIRKSRELLKINQQIYDKMTEYMSEYDAALMLSVIINLAVALYYNLYATWFMKLFLSPWGISTLYRIIIRNPFYGIIFFSSFYLQVLKESDKEKFNYAARALGLPDKDTINKSHYIELVVAKITKLLNSLGLPENINISNTVKGLLATVYKMTGNLTLDALFKTVIPTEIKNYNPPAIYLTERDKLVYDDTELYNYLQQIDELKKSAKKELRQTVNPKRNPVLWKKRLEERILKKGPSGKNICLNECKRRVKTKIGCLCESDCGPSTFLNNKSWCRVDPKTCSEKKRKQLGYSKIYGYYDYCDPKHMSETKQCFTGLTYEDCKTDKDPIP